MTTDCPHYINGFWTASNGERFASQNPATGELLWKGNSAEQKEVDAAIAVARQSLDQWSVLPLEERISYLKTFYVVAEKEKESFASTISKETGKPLWESLSEVKSCLAKIDIAIAAYHDRCKELQKDLPQGKLITRHKPHGVIAIFGPFNFPAHIPGGHLFPALLAGNTIVFKPSEYTPLVAEVMLQLWEKAKLPPGVINMVQGGRETGKIIAAHSGINGIFFTGSWPVGKILAEQNAANTGKIIALELGGNNPLIISQTKNIDAAVFHTIQSAYITTGQRCSCARRLILIDNPSSEKYLNSLVTAIKQIKVGNCTETPEPFMGPVISENAAINLEQTQKQLIQKGGKTIVPLKHLKKGTGFVSPGLIDVTEMKERSDEEFFGPLLQLIRVNNLEEAVLEANNTQFGLTAGILTDDEAEYRYFFQHARAGVVNWNTQLTGASSYAPFGGIGHSGNFRPSAYYAADYSVYPVASLESKELSIPKDTPPGL